ncbi:MAG: primosomal protein N' [Anaerolineae bacterium]|nr:primosomal protein N' [Anaerolineae bacterium]
MIIIDNMYAEIAINVPVQHTFHYHVPPEFEAVVEPGQLVQVAFGTAMQHGIVLRLAEHSDIRQTKPIEALLDTRPVLTGEQIALAHWISETYLMPFGLCLWLFLPPGITGKRDLQVTLVDEQSDGLDELQERLVALLKRRGPLRGQQLNQSLSGKDWRGAVQALVKAGIVRTENVLAPPRTKPKLVRTATLTIPADQIMNVARHLGRSSKQADVLEVLAAMPDEEAELDRVLRIAECSRGVVDRLEKDGLVTINRYDRGQQDDPLLVSLNIPRESVDENLITLRKGEKYLHILKVLARENGPVDVSWIYAQTDAKLPDLKRLEEEGLVLLSEREAWRDSLADRDFVPTIAPPLTPEQQAVWEPIEAKIKSWDWGNLAHQQQEQNLIHEADLWEPSPYHQAQVADMAEQKPQEAVPAEEHLWQYLRQSGHPFRQHYRVERFIVDFFCPGINLVIEIEDKPSQYPPKEAAARRAFLKGLGLMMLRFSANEIFDEMDVVLERVEEAVALLTRSSQLPEQPPTPQAPDLPSVFLLHGVTGSGKTEIYLRAMELTLAQGRQVMFLVPEIALTPQTVRRIASRFPGRLAVMHGSLSEGERYDTWRRAREGMVEIIIGARSALFTPFPDVGLIILDEEHDHSYKQGAGFSQPYYHARRLAEVMMHRNDGVLILGSATPDLETMFRARRGEMALLQMPNRIMGHRTRILELSEREGVKARYYPASAQDAMTIDLPPVQVVDMREELKAGNTSIFSQELQDGLTAVLDKGEQAILFLNRRGANTFVFCRDCGYVDHCPRCDTPLTHHRYDNRMRCHLCGYTSATRQVCPSCQSRRIKFFGAGTQHVEQEMKRQFPLARVVRWDADTARDAQTHEALLEQFVEQRADVLIGTQMVAKGLDLPLVTLVGVISADVGMGLPDFRANERTFQMLTQVAGRAGRGLLGGRALLQTYQPDHYALVAATQHDYDAFYTQEIASRRDLHYPPFQRLLRILFQLGNDSKAQLEAERAADLLRQRITRAQIPDTHIIGPAPCFFARVNNIYRWHVLLRGPDPTAVLRDFDIPRNWYVDVDPVDVL